ncbi:prostaglandin F2 receptor negative regulator [Ambystoma mexicanum]|uniref:prostaglandin F2 receptor negative regulator n=1 Tax=Ambystoma mexicanum TaxID=8296 RepID=UPI0037E93EC4
MEPGAAVPMLWLGLCGLCMARVVKVPAGPLLRVEGTEVAIPCDVSEYEGPSEQNFDWQVTRGGVLEGVVSTWDASFTDAAFRGRVQSGAIELRRTNNSAVELRIKGLEATDQGEYKCSTPSTDATVSGNYEASVHVRVIADALKVSRLKGRSASSPNITEGGDFQLQCLASTASAEHTHLSVSWEIRRPKAGGGTWQGVLSLSHQGLLQPGPGYEIRSQNGDTRLDRTAGDAYRLMVSHALPEDGGEYRCVVQEWVQGADGSWQQIQQKELAIATLEVSPIALSVAVTESDVVLRMGDPLELTCVVTAAVGGMAQIELAWYLSPTADDSLQGSRIVASVDHQSVVNESGNAHLSHVEAGSYRLSVGSTGAADGGFYFCRVGVWVPQSNGSWYKATEETSPPANVVLSLAVPTYRISLEAPTIPTVSEDPMELVCKVSTAELAAEVRFSVSWYYEPRLRSDAIAASELIGSMDQDSVLQVEDRYKERALDGDMVFFKPDVSSYSLRIRRTLDTDRGNYHCMISSWSREGIDGWTKSKEETSKSVNIFWPIEDYHLAVQALEERPHSAPGSTFQMSCKASPRNLKDPRFSVVVTAEKPAAGTARILSLSHDSLVRLEDWKDPGRQDAVVLERIQENVFRFRMHQTQLTDAGLYRCVVTAWTLGGGGVWQEAINATSEPIKMEFQTSGPVFNVSLHSDSPAVYPGERVELHCIVTIQGPAVDPDDLSFDVYWFVVRSSALDKAPVFLASLDRRAVVSQAPRNGSSDVGVERVSAMEFRLRVHGCEEQDFGSHYCTVTPWVRSSADSWQRQPDIKSKPILVSIKPDMLSAFRYPLLIGIAFAAAVGLLSCLIGYCSTRYCCKKLPAQEVRRDQRRRLMSMEMD